MAHRRVKNIEYDDDDYEYDYEDDLQEDPTPAAGTNELTDEDREQLSSGTVKVRQQLTDYPQISDAAIHDALYHYWYDVDKTVVYLKNENRPQQKKQPKPASKFDQAAAASAQKADQILPSGESHFHMLKSQYAPGDQIAMSGPGSLMRSWLDALSARRPTSNTSADFSDRSSMFDDMDWSAPKPENQAVFTPVDIRSRPLLLGGSGKPSKLAALAAARKAKKENASPDKLAGRPEESLATLSLLGSLGANNPASIPLRSAIPTPQAVPEKPAAATKQAAVASNPNPSTVGSAATTRSAESPGLQNIAIQPTTTLDDPRSQPSAFASTTALADLQSPPSIFASQLCGPPILARKTSYSNWQTSIASALLGTTGQIPQDGFQTPSPDTVISRAQAKGKATPKQPSKPNKDPARVADAVDNLTIDDAPRDRPRVATKVQSKNLNVIKEYEKSQPKKEAKIVIVGHVDHGKSTLMGRLLFENNVVDQRTLDKYRKEAAKLGKESFALAWVMDAREDEREHGVTIDYSEKNFETEKTAFTILDAPGHKDFVSNMIAGTSMADFALLVVDAGTNSFLAGLKGQTKEHAQVVRSMKLEKLVVAVNKMDSVNWSEERYRDVCTQTTAFLQDCLFSPANIVFVPCSGLNGDNVTQPTQAASWYQGPTLVQALDALEPDRAQYLGPISSPFRLRITGLVGLTEFSEFLSPTAAHEPFAVLGRIDAGNVQIGDRIISQPNGETATVKGITRRGAPADWAVAGQIVGLQLTDCDEDRFGRGDLVCGADRPAKAVTSATVKILAFDPVFPMPVDVHRGRMRAEARVTRLLATLDPKSHAVLREAPKVVRAGEVARVVVEFDEAVALERPARVVLRYAGETVAAGAVERSE